MTVTPDWTAEKPAVQPCMAAPWALEPEPFSVPLSSGALLLAALPLAAEPVVLLSLDAPQAARARVAARAEETAAARVVVLSFNSGPFNWGVPGHRCRAVCVT